MHRYPDHAIVPYTVAGENLDSLQSLWQAGYSLNTSLDRVHYLVSIVVWKDSDLDDALPLDYFGFKPFYAGKIVNGLLDPDTDRLLDFQGA